jgi:predicted component of type VI protein secretion system
MTKLLALKVISRPDESDTTPLTAHFDASGGLIGRAETARLLLPDPKRMVSRFHAHVSFHDGNYYLEDMGSTNPASVNGQALASGQKVPLNAGDRIRIGHYTIACDFEESSAVAAIAAAHEFSSGDDEIEQHTRILARQPVIVAAGNRAMVSADDLWRAFEEGAGVQVDLPGGLRPELMRTIGGMVRDAIGGLRRLLLSRREAKKEVESDVTTLRVRGINNPLKFAQDDVRATMNVLKPPIPGFMTGPDAIKDAVLDLESHIAATTTAMRVAAERVLARFEPEALAGRLSGSGLLGSVLPMARKARLWELYIEQYRVVARDAQAAFQQAFDEAFAAAYEAEVQRIRKEQQSRRAW